MDINELLQIRNYHLGRLDQFGDNLLRAQGWRLAESQEKRFEQLVSAADYSNKLVLDLGCGTGDFKAYLDDRFEGVDYLGIDLLLEFIQIAKTRYAEDPKAQFVQADFTNCVLPRADVIVLNGPLNYQPYKLEPWLAVIKQLFALCTDTLAFNFLNARVFEETDTLVGYALEDVLPFCQQLTPEVEVRDQYVSDDITLIMRHPRG